MDIVSSTLRVLLDYDLPTDVATLDEAFKSCDRWMGCLLCPDPGPGGEEDIESMVMSEV